MNGQDWSMPWWQDSDQPQFAKVLLYLDDGDDLEVLRPVLDRWHDEACRLLLDRIVPGARADAPSAIIATEEYPDGRVKERRPGSWHAAATEHLSQASVTWANDSDPAAGAEMNLLAYRFAAPEHVFLEATVSGTGLADAVLQLVPWLRSVADTTNPAYGEIVVNREVRPPDTALDTALRRYPDDSARDSRRYLRGYEWVTICAKELAERLGGAERLRASGAFADVVALRSGAVLLQATPTPAEYGAQEARAVFDTVRAVLPPGQPRPMQPLDLGAMVFEDAAR